LYAVEAKYEEKHPYLNLKKLQFGITRHLYHGVWHNDLVHVACKSSVLKGRCD
jgi:hypothetical protein